jgi:hypothetical protein
MRELTPTIERKFTPDLLAEINACRNRGDTDEQARAALAKCCESVEELERAIAVYRLHRQWRAAQ